jgi:predicted MPP superfamily phosphohydrolase
VGIVFGIIDMKIESTLDSLLRDLSVSSYSIKCLILLFLFSFSLVFLINHSYATDKNEFASKVQKFNFVVAGDFGCGDEAKKTIDMMSSKQPELVIALGDLAYKKNPDCWFNLISPLEKDNKFKISFGDHDVSRGNVTYGRYLNYFNLSKPFYSFDYNNVHFVAMATAKHILIPYNETSEQYQFITNDLIQASKNKKIDWIIVYSFRSFYSSNTTHPGLDELQDTYHPLFEKYNVDLVLQAHNHNYQRTYPLSYNVTKQYTPIITDKNTEYYNNIEKGQIFFTVGTGGAEFYNFTGQAPYVVKQLLRHGFLNVDVDDSGSKLLVTFYDNSGATRDQIIISKQKSNN